MAIDPSELSARTAYHRHTVQLAERVHSLYHDLNVVKIARALCPSESVS